MTRDQKTLREQKRGPLTEAGREQAPDDHTEHPRAARRKSHCYLRVDVSTIAGSFAAGSIFMSMNIPAGA